MRKDDTSHMSIVSCLVVVRERSLALILTALVLVVELTAQIALEFVILSALLMHLT